MGARWAGAVSFRRAEPADARALALHHADCFLQPWSADELARMLVKPASIALLAVEPASDALIGHIILQAAADEADIVSIGVAPAKRMQGLAGNLLHEGLREARSRGAICVSLEVAESNLAAQALYRRAGFAEIGRRRGYYRKPGRPAETALVLQWRLAEET